MAGGFFSGGSGATYGPPLGSFTISTKPRGIPGGRAWTYDLSAPGVNERAGLVERLIANRVAPGDLGENELLWGGPSRFERLLAEEQPVVTKVNFPDDEEPGEEEALQWYEIDREEEEVRIENPDDEEMWVDTKRITWVMFKGPDGRLHQFNYRYPED